MADTLRAVNNQEEARETVRQIMTIAVGSQLLAIASFFGAFAVVAIEVAVGLATDPGGEFGGDKVVLPALLLAAAVISQIVSGVSNSRAVRIATEFNLR
jgi:hypothetical protein